MTTVTARVHPFHLMNAPFPRKKLPFPLEIWTSSNTLFLEPTRVHNPNGISICSAVFAGLMVVTDRPTDRQTDRSSYSPSMPHLASASLRHKKHAH